MKNKVLKINEFNSFDIYNNIINNYGEIDIINLDKSVIVQSDMNTLKSINEEYGGEFIKISDELFQLEIKK